MRLIKTRTERGRPGTEARLMAGYCVHGHIIIKDAPALKYLSEQN